jgi:predicted RNase H-like nuclease (RuvC/YqgF family)
MAAKSRATPDRINELEDIICTLKFEINGLKAVVFDLEDKALADREKLKVDFQREVDGVMSRLEQLNRQVEEKIAYIAQLEAKVYVSLHLVSNEKQ